MVRIQRPCLPAPWCLLATIRNMHGTKRNPWPVLLFRREDACPTACSSRPVYGAFCAMRAQSQLSSCLLLNSVSELHSNHQGDQGHWQGHWGETRTCFQKDFCARVAGWWKSSVHGCTQLGHAITQAANANRPKRDPLPGSFACTKRGWAGQHLETHGPHWTQIVAGLTKP